LGEVAVLFMVAAGVGLVLGGKAVAQTDGRDTGAATPASEILRAASQILIPLIAIFAAYIIMNGHISAGGGFQGGAP
jgi:multicomponent Na+:H+ antiporter subunit B